MRLYLDVPHPVQGKPLHHQPILRNKPAQQLQRERLDVARLTGQAGVEFIDTAEEATKIVTAEVSNAEKDGRSYR